MQQYLSEMQLEWARKWNSVFCGSYCSYITAFLIRPVLFCLPRKSTVTVLLRMIFCSRFSLIFNIVVLSHRWVYNSVMHRRSQYRGTRCSPCGEENAENQTDFENLYFESYAKTSIHQQMIRDKVRTGTYRNAIIHNKHLFRGKVSYKVVV